MSNRLLILFSLAVVLAHAQQKNGFMLTSATLMDQQRQSLLIQRSSITHQVLDNHFSTSLGNQFDGKDHSVSAPTPLCPALPFSEREALVAGAAQKEGIDPDLIRAVMRHESGFRPCAVSAKGATGLMQLMPSTIAQFHVVNPFDPAESTYAGAALLRSLIAKYKGDLRLALGAYNAGSARIDNIDPQSYPAETRSYIADVLTELGVESRF